MKKFKRNQTPALRLACVTFIFLIATYSNASAKNISFQCGNVEFLLNTSDSIISNRFLNKEPIEWQYDGEWLRWKIKRTGERFGVNKLNGYFLSGAESVNAGCRFENIRELENLPRSEGSFLREVFIGLSPDDRKDIQDHLRYLNFYEEKIDGLWGQRTQEALISYSKWILEKESLLIDPRSESGAQQLIEKITLDISERQIKLETVSAHDASANKEIDLDRSGTKEENTRAFYQNCIATIDSISDAIIRMQIKDVATIYSVWPAVGIDPKRINKNMSGSGLRRLVDPIDYIPSSSQKNQICTEYQTAYSRYVDKTIQVKTNQKTIRRSLYEASLIEKSNIPGTWGFGITALKSQLAKSIETLFVSYRHEVRHDTGTASCRVSFHILPETVGFETVRLAPSSLYEVVDVYKHVVWGFPVIGVTQISNPRERILLTYLTGHGYGSDELIRLIDESLSVFSGTLDWKKLDRLTLQLNNTGRNLARFEFQEATPREENSFAQSPECIAALNEAREQFARDAR